MIQSLPVIYAEIRLPSKTIGVQFLCDTGSSLNCIKTEILKNEAIQILPSQYTPVGAGGTKLQTNGDVDLLVILSSHKKGIRITKRFVMLDNIGYDGILGMPTLGEIGFNLLPNGNSVMIGGVLLPRVFGHGNSINALTTSLHSSGGETLTITGSSRTKLTVELNTTHKAHCEEVDAAADATNIPTTSKRERALNQLTITKEKMEGPMIRDIRVLSADRVADSLVAVITTGSTPVPDRFESNGVDSVLPGYDDVSSCDDGDESTRQFETNTIVKDLTDEVAVTGGQLKALVSVLRENVTVFSKSDSDIGLFKNTDGGPDEVEFCVRDPSVFVYNLPRRVPYARRQWLIDKLEDLKRTGIIRERDRGCQEPIQTSPIVLVRKKQANQFRMAIDFREVNRNILPSTHPLPNIKDLVESLSQKRFFSALDLCSAFHQVGVTKKSQNLLGFCTLDRRFQFLRMPFGINACPGAFQQIMTRVVRGLRNVVVYLDDILVCSTTFEEHLMDLQAVFTAIERHNMKLNHRKCLIVRNRLNYLGFVIGKTETGWGYIPAPEKIEALRNTRMPETAKECRQFAGSLQYYNALIPRLNILLGPIHKGSAAKPFTMTIQMQEAFHLVMQALKKNIELAFPDFSCRFHLTTDASYEGAAGILSQVTEENEEQVIQVFSKAFSDQEKRWAAVELEMMALVWSLEKMRTLLLGRQFTWFTDSKVLMQMLCKPPTNLSRAARKISRFIDVISQFDIEMKHVKGTTPPMLLADFLSRTPIQTIQTLFRCQITVDEWREAVQQDTELMNRSGAWERWKESLFMEDGIVFLNKHPRCKVAVPHLLRRKVLHYYHCSYTVHGGTSRMIGLIGPLYFWPNCFKDIRDHCRACEDCVAVKRHPVQKGVDTPIETPTAPARWIQVDLVAVTQKPSLCGNRYCLTAICTLTNFLFAEPIPTKEAVVVLKALCKLFCLIGVPEIIQSDNGREFKNDIMKANSERLGIEWRFSSSYKPSTNGRVERRHSDLAKLLRLLKSTTENWDEELPYAIFEINNTVDKCLSITPAEAFLGWCPRTPHILDIPAVTPSTDFINWAASTEKIHWEEGIRSAQRRTFARIHEQRQAHKEQRALATPLAKQLVPGDRVMIKLPTAGKLENKRTGPYKVTRVNKGGSFVAEEEGGTKIVRLPAEKAVRIKPKQHDDFDAIIKQEKTRNENQEWLRADSADGTLERLFEDSKQDNQPLTNEDEDVKTRSNQTPLPEIKRKLRNTKTVDYRKYF